MGNFEIVGITALNMGKKLILIFTFFHKSSFLHDLERSRNQNGVCSPAPTADGKEEQVVGLPLNLQSRICSNAEGQ